MLKTLKLNLLELAAIEPQTFKILSEYGSKFECSGGESISLMSPSRNLFEIVVSEIRELNDVFENQLFLENMSENITLILDIEAKEDLVLPPGFFLDFNRRICYGCVEIYVRYDYHDVSKDEIMALTQRSFAAKSTDTLRTVADKAMAECFEDYEDKPYFVVAYEIEGGVEEVALFDDMVDLAFICVPNLVLVISNIPQMYDSPL
jgi:hypothetical protein